jgi:iron complex outermembrane receptor protein
MSFKKYTRNKSLSRLPLVAAVVAGLYGPAVMAQDPPAEPETEEQAEAAEDAQQLQTITVTGSLINRLGFNTISPVQIITADVSATTGQLDTTRILQTTSVAAGSTQISNQFSGFVTEGGNGVQTVSLRGLGANRTLVLLDGKRPGPAGTRGQVAAFDLNVIPSVILQRVEILKDGGGSLYGSDAVAGVVNLITRKSVDRPTLIFDASLPEEGGGSTHQLAGATGWNFDRGSVVAAFQYYNMQPLKQGDRDFFKCPRDLVRNANGDIIDRVDRSVIGGTDLGGCNRLYANTVISGASRFVPSPNGVTIGPIPGYRPRANANASGGNPAFYEDVLNFDFMDNQHIFSKQERISLFTSADFSFDRVDWSGQFLYNNRTTESRRFRQFFPTMDFSANGLSAFSLPIMPFPSNQDIDVDFFYAASTFKGGFGSDSTWSWNFDTTFSRSDGDYSVLSIDSNKTGDRNRDLDGGGPPVNYLDPVFLSGQGMSRLVEEVGVWHTGNTVYDQFVVNATATGELMELPAGNVAAAIGTEFRRISIDDAPSDLERTGRLWGQSSATGTVGTDYIYEAFGEIEVPLISGMTGVEELVVNASGRVFKYDTVDDSDSVWKIGMGWQVVPSVRVRATRGTSYRAPGLYELFLGDQTAFVGQLAVDPCIDWGNSTNTNVRANCAAEGIPSDYNGAGASATIVQGGGLGVLKPETSTSTTYGVVFTPAWSNFSASLDYFEIDVRDQIDTLSGARIVSSCYNLPVFPNQFCSLFTRNGSGAFPFNIDLIQASYVNINQLYTSGYDLNMRWDGDFSFGKVEVETQFTYTDEQIERFFDASLVSGFATDEVQGLVSNPQLVGNIRTALNRGDFTYTWGMRYIDETENDSRVFTPPASYFGNPNPVYDNVAGSALYHSLSVLYRSDNWDLLVGVDNVLDRDPPEMSAGAGSTLYGNVPAFATQYDWFGRSLFARMTYRF